MADRSIYSDPNYTPRNRWEILNAYGEHADVEEEQWDALRVRRFIVKAVTPLFAGEPNAKKYRIALDEIAGLPKKLMVQGKSLDGTPRISELILNAACEHLSEEALFRSPEESYERVLWEEEKRKIGGGRSLTLLDWQERRQQERQSEGSRASAT